MNRYWLSCLIFVSGFIPLSYANAAGCYFPDDGNINVAIPQMAIPADTPNGTVLYSSPERSINISCNGERYVPGEQISAVATADFSKFMNVRRGIRTTLYLDDRPFTPNSEIHLGNTSGPASSPSFRKIIRMRVEVKVDRTMGSLPPQGTYLHGGFQSVYVMISGNYSDPRGVISLYTPDITFIPCSMELALYPDTIDFGQIPKKDLEQGRQYSRTFSTRIMKSSGCRSPVDALFGINMTFEPSGQSLTADGSLDLDNGIGLSILDSGGEKIPFNTEWKIHDVRTSSVLQNNFTASIQKIAGGDIRAGIFAGEVIVRMDYF